jgi:hypothetical protein
VIGWRQETYPTNRWQAFAFWMWAVVPVLSRKVWVSFPMFYVILNTKQHLPIDILKL